MEQQTRRRRGRRKLAGMKATTFIISEEALLRIDAIVGRGYQRAQFIRDLVDQELERLESEQSDRAAA